MHLFSNKAISARAVVHFNSFSFNTLLNDHRMAYQENKYFPSLCK